MSVSAFPADIPICDPHFHVWDNVSNPKNLNLGDIADGPLGVYLSADYLKGAGDLPLRSAVHVETVVGQDGSFDIDTVAETKFVAKDTASAFGPSRPVGISAFVHLGRTDAQAVLDAHAAAADGDGKRFVGVRMILNYSAEDKSLTWPQVAHGRYLKGEDQLFIDNLSLLGARGLVFDLHANWYQLADAATLLFGLKASGKPFPKAVVVDHLGVPKLGVSPAEDARRIAQWKTGMAALAAVGPEVCVKISGLEYIRAGWIEGMPAYSADAKATVTSMVHWVVSTFGVSRCMVASNFPVDLAMGGVAMPAMYAALYAVLKEYAHAQLDHAAMCALFHDNAVRVYGLDALKGSA